MKKTIPQTVEVTVKPKRGRPKLNKRKRAEDSSYQPFVKLFIKSDEDRERFIEFQRIVILSGGDPFDALMNVANAYIRKYKSSRTLVSRKRIFELAAEMKVKFNDNDFSHYKKTRFKEGMHYRKVKTSLRGRVVYIWDEQEMIRFLKWLKKFRKKHKHGRNIVRRRVRDEETGELVLRKPKRKRGSQAKPKIPKDSGNVKVLTSIIKTSVPKTLVRQPTKEERVERAKNAPPPPPVQPKPENRLVIQPMRDFSEYE